MGFTISTGGEVGSGGGKVGGTVRSASIASTFLPPTIILFAIIAMMTTS